MSTKSDVLRAVLDIIQQAQAAPHGLEHDNGQVVDLLAPEALMEKFMERTGTTLVLGNAWVEQEDGGTTYDVARALGNAIRDLSVDTSHNLFFNQLYGAVDAYGLAGELLSSCLNTSAYTFEVAPVMTLMEQEVLRACYETMGWTQQADLDLGGLMVPGGSVGNLYGLNLGRYHALGADVLARGNAAASGPLVAFCSQEAHYSFLKSSALIGIGRDQLIQVACDVQGAMLPDALDRAIVLAKASGQVPFMVAATSGSTVVGAFDPLHEIARTCRRHGNIWMHVDAAWGFPVVWSQDRHVRELMDGIALADSCTWNPHKLLGAPLQTTIFVTRHANVLQACHSTRASYLFHPDQANASLDLGDLSLFCGRKSDVVKIWFMWKMLGHAGFGRRVDHAISLLQYAVKAIQKHSRFILASPPNALNVCFYVIPAELVPTLEKELSLVQETSCPRVSCLPRHLSSSLQGVTRRVKLKLQQTGSVLIACQPVPGQDADAFRLVIAGDRDSMDESHIDTLLRNIICECDES